ncbi:MAG: Type 1 glutamine amidotransferase-like domain-containing protein [Actinomycetota bacterium]|jgi:cyanophycinase|nr:Type 1 glutamine amidotransferase-like domain-containing protein [Actinomycetota bacterium]
MDGTNGTDGVGGVTGTLALVGGGEWRDGCTFDADLLEASGDRRVVVLPTAAAYERPERLVVRAAEWFAPLGADVEGVMVLSRGDAADPGTAAVVRRARFLYLAGGSPMHLRSVLKDSVVWDAVVAAWHDGAVIAGSSAAAMVLTDPMVDARGGGLTVGLGLLQGLAVVPHFGDVHEDAHGAKLHRSVLLAPPGIPVAGIPERTALVRDPRGAWSSAGAGEVRVFLDGSPAGAGLGALPGPARVA